jgi:hypothetical protein
MGKETMRIAFLTGCARSGTSIFGELLGAHPDVEYRHEAHHLWAKAGSGPQGSHRLTAEQATADVVRYLRKQLAPAGPGALVLEKNPRTMLRVPFIRAVFPEARFIHLVRDGRDVACSLLPGVGGDEWRHLRPLNWQELFAETSGVVRCAHLWRASIETAAGDLSGTSHVTVRYEDLIRDPLSIASDVLRFLGLPDDSAVRDFSSRLQNETAGSYQPEKQRKWFREDHRVRVGRWRENLSEEELRGVEEVERELLARFGYELAHTSNLA